MAGPLAGIRVLNWSQFTPSSAGYILGDLGADVIKIEHPVQGDAYRGMGRMYGEAMSMAGGRHAGFEAVNRNQRSVTLDLKNDRGRAILYRLVKKSDVFFTNYTDAVAHKLGADYETLSKLHPKLIYASSSTYGPSGPWAGRRGFDQTAQARSGLMYAMGEREFPEPVQTVSGVADQMGATILVQGILAALVARERQGTGQKIDVSLLGSMIHLQAIGVGVTSFRGKSWVRHGRKRARNPLTNHYRCADDKWLLFAEIQADRFWREFCQALGLEELEHDERFATAMGGRREHFAELIDILDETLASKPRDEWLRIFEEQDVPFAYSPVLDYYEVLDDPQVLENEYVVGFDHPAAGKIKVMGHPVRFSETPAQVQREAPEFGQHTEEVLQELGFSWEEIASLREQGVV
ncbi:MAG: CoA transferase [Dehalococcoidia bacterium]|nr:CoA transferase [Dehalococcoidia bacterium]